MFSDWLKAELKKRDWNQKEAADRIGVSRSYIQKILSGERTNISTAICDKIAFALGIAPEIVYKEAILGDKELDNALLKNDQRDESLREIIAWAETLTPKQRSDVVSFIRSVVLRNDPDTE